MIPLNAYQLDADNYLKTLEAKGEKVTLYFRWIFVIVIIAILVLYYKKYTINRNNVYLITLALAPILYSSFLSFIFKKNMYRPFIKYISMFFDISLISVGIHLSSYAYSPLYPTTSPALFIYAIILSLCIARINSRFIIIATLYTLISYNIVYLLWYKTFSNSADYSLILSLGYTYQQHFLKSIFIAILGVISYYTISLLRRFAIDTVEATTKVKQADSRLIKQYKIILNNINIGIAIININNIVLFMNHTLVNMLKYNKNEVIGKNLLDLIHPGKDRKNSLTYQIFKKKIEIDKNIQIKLSLTEKNGETIPVQVHLAKAYILDDHSYLLTIFDLRRQALLEERLLHSRKMETAGRLASGFAHDFNNLISILNQYIYDVVDSKETIGNKFINRISSIINRQKELVELLYKISGKMEDSEVKLSITKLFSKIINLLSPIISDNISLQVKSYIPESIIFSVNETAILQIILNLILNAKEAIEPKVGNIEVTASITRDCDRSNAVLLPANFRGQEYIMLAVRDNGPGIPKNILNRIFDPYISTKSDKSSMKRGLGLSFIYAITEQLNGGISITTKRGLGTTFKIYIPTKTISEKFDDSIAKKVNEKPVKNNNRKQEGLILYIDDDEDMRVITSKILEKHGYKVYAVNNGNSALRLLEKNYYDIIMTDFYLPDIEGDKLVLKLKERCNTPIILMTGANTSKLQELKGVNAVLNKPIEVDKLIKTIDDAVKNGN